MPSHSSKPLVFSFNHFIIQFYVFIFICTFKVTLATPQRTQHFNRDVWGLPLLACWLTRRPLRFAFCFGLCLWFVWIIRMYKFMLICLRAVDQWLICSRSESDTRIARIWMLISGWFLNGFMWRAILQVYYFQDQGRYETGMRQSSCSTSVKWSKNGRLTGPN